MKKLKKTLEIDIVLTSDSTFDLEFYEPESGEFKRISCKDNPDAFTEVHENTAIGNEIRSWVSLLREEHEN